MRKIFAILIARNKEFYRDKGVMAWNFLFPFLIVFGFSYAFSGKTQQQFKVGVYPEELKSTSNLDFFNTEYVQFVSETDLNLSIDRVRRHQLDLLIAPDAQAKPQSSAYRYWINSSSPKGYLLDRILKGSVRPDQTLRREPVQGAELRYVDWLIPGILGMNMMFSALFGVGYVIVRYRKNGMLKRLKATPLLPFEFLGAQVLSRLIILLVNSAVILIGCRWLAQSQIHGSVFTLFLVYALGGVCLISMGLVVAARVSSEELAGGLLNMCSWPMMFLSGVWFSLEGAHPWMVRFSEILPLTHIIVAARAVWLDGATLAQISPQLAILGIMTAVFMTVGSLAFRWQ